MASPPITTTEVGATRFRTPDALWNAVTTRLRRASANEASGVITGREAWASPDDDGMSSASGRGGREKRTPEGAPPASPRADPGPGKAGAGGGAVVAVAGG